VADVLRQFRERITVIPFGIDLDAWQPSDRIRRRADEIPREANSPIVLFVGWHVPYKGVDIETGEVVAPGDVDVLRAAIARSRGSSGAEGCGRVSRHAEQLAERQHFVLPADARSQVVLLTRMATGTTLVRPHGRIPRFSAYPCKL
jgi:hypothetical protein